MAPPSLAVAVQQRLPLQIGASAKLSGERPVLLQPAAPWLTTPPPLPAHLAVPEDVRPVLVPGLHLEHLRARPAAFSVAPMLEASS
jgi:hypothetical protein